MGFVGRVPLGTTHDLRLRFVFAGPAFEVLLRGFVVAEAADHGHVESGVGLAVGTAVPPVTPDLSGGGGERGGTAEFGEAGLSGDASGVAAAGDQGLGGVLDAEAGPLQQ
nr:hypothetical protein [Streptomyces minutiscleroticus]